MNDVWVDRFAIMDVKHRYCYHLDMGNVDEFVDLFAEEISFDPKSYDGVIESKNELREWMTWRKDNFGVKDQTSAAGIEFNTHIATNPIIDVSGDTAVGKWCLLVLVKYEDGKAEWGVGRYEDEYHRVGAEWKIFSSNPKRDYTKHWDSIPDR